MRLLNFRSSAVIARTTYFLLFWGLSLLLFRRDLGDLLALSWTDNRYAHLVIVPFISLGIVYLKRKRVFSEIRYSPWVSLAVVALGGALFYVGKEQGDNLGLNGRLALAASAMVFTWTAGFIFFYGARSAKAASFPLAFLLLAIPIPSEIVQVAEVALQKGSAEVTYVIFILLSIPVFREGLVFSLPGVTIEVARECSGIRSSISLLITALVLGNLFLRSNWTRVCCVILTVPIAILKNAVRIATLSSLGTYVSLDYLHGSLHHRGGPIFSALSLALLLTVLWLLRMREGRAAGVPLDTASILTPLLGEEKHP